MKYRGFFVNIIYIVLAIPFSLEKEISSSRLITKWELEFLSLNFRQLLRKIPCSADQAFSSQFPVNVIVGYVLPNGHTGKIGMTIERPEVDCSDGSLDLRNSGSSNRMTISAASDETCLKGARLQLHINIQTKDDLTPSSHFHKDLYPAQAGPVWTPVLLLDNTDGTALRLNLRVSCEELEGKDNTLRNVLRLRRQADSEPPTENALEDFENITKYSTVLISKDHTISKEHLTSPNPNSTTSGEVLSTTFEDSSGEPPDSFVTGISEIFGLTKNPFSPRGMKTTHPSTASKQFSTLLQTLFGSTADVTLLRNRETSISVDHSPQDNEFTVSASSLAPSSPSPGDTRDGLYPDVTGDANGWKINAPAAGQGDSQNPDLDTPKTDSIVRNTAEPNSFNVDSTEKVSVTQSTKPNEKHTSQTEGKSSTIIKDINTVTVSGNASSPKHLPEHTPTKPDIPGDINTDSKKAIPTKPAMSSKTNVEAMFSSIIREITTTSVTQRKQTKEETSTKPSKTTVKTDKSERTTSITTTPKIRLTTSASRTRPSTRRDVIFTKAKTKPTASLPETSNEAFMGKTGETSSAGRVKDHASKDTDSDDERTEATLWPIVMGLVIGIPTIIVLSIAITVVQKKHIGIPHRHLSSPGYFERRPPPVPFVGRRSKETSCDLERPPTDIEV